MTIAPFAPVEVSIHSQSSPVAFADDAASAVAAQVALDAGLTDDQATLLQETLAANMTPWFNRVAEIERGHVARYLNRLSAKAHTGQMLGDAAADALSSASERLVPQVHRAPDDILLASWGPSTA